MKRTGTIKIENQGGNGDISAACRLTRRLPGVVWSDLNTDAELSVIYDDLWITLPAIASALNGIGAVVIFAVSAAAPKRPPYGMKK